MFGGGNTGFNFAPTTTAAPFGTTPSFGQQSTSTLGSSSLFGQPSSTSIFGTQPQPQAGPAVGGAFNFPSASNTLSSFAAPAFGQVSSQPATSQTGFSFPSAGTVSQPMLGSSTFGAQQAQQPTTGSLFGSASSQPAAPSLFGQPTNQSSLGFASNPAPLFGTQPVTSTASSFGTLSTPSFGLTGTVPTTSAPLFGGGSTASFGVTATTANSFGSTFSATPSQFGVTSTPSLGTFTTPSTITSATGFSLGQSTAPAAPSGTSLFNLTTPAPLSSASTGFNLSTITPSSGLSTTTLPSFSALPTATTASTGFNFGQTAPSVPIPATTASTGQSVSFGLNLATTSAPAAVTSTPQLNLNFTAPSSFKPTVGIAPAATTAPSSLTTLIATQAPTAITSTTLSVPSKPTTGFSITPLATSSTTTATTVSSVPEITSSSIPQITFGKLEDQINLWMNELAQFESDFHSQGQTINSWDSLLISNGQKLIEMKESIEKLKSAHRGLDHQLDFIIAQQKELEQLLDQIEQNKFEISPNNVNAEREQTYSMLETVNNDLNAIGSDLKDFIKKLNETKSNQDSNDPIVQISKILNSHMDVLQWIENQIKNVKLTC